MKNNKEIALLLGIPIIIGGVMFLASKIQAGRKKYLYITTGEGGTTDPPPGTYFYSLGENVTITALPYEGYTVGSWTVDGVNWGHGDSITITMDADHTVIVTFWEGGTPPPTTPVGVKPLPGYETVTVTQNIGVYNDGGTLRVRHFKDDWSREGWSMTPVKFLVYDAANNGVPDVDVALWTSGQDTSKYKGIPMIDGRGASGENPVVKKTDSNGVVTVGAGYMYGLNDQFSSICDDGGISFDTGCVIYPMYGLHVWDGRGVCDVCGAVDACWGLTGTHGDCQTGQSGCEALGIYWPNYVFAQIVGTTRGGSSRIDCGFHIKWV